MVTNQGEVTYYSNIEEAHNLGMSKFMIVNFNLKLSNMS